MRKYFTLCTRDAGQWSPQFGDYVKRVVSDERRDSYAEYTADNVRIIESGETYAEIESAVADLNAATENDCDVYRVETVPCINRRLDYHKSTVTHVTVPRHASERLVIRRAKSALHLSTTRARTVTIGECIEIHPAGRDCTVFVYPRDAA